MRAIVMRSFGGPEVLELQDLDAPIPGPTEVLVRVCAVEVSRTRDAATRSGNHPFSRQVTLPHVLGGDFAGIVEQVGAQVDPKLTGQRCAVAGGIYCGQCEACGTNRQHECVRLEMVGIHRWGSYAEFVRVPASNVYPIPDDVGMGEAAAMAATGAIALMQLREAQVKAGGRLLITGLTGALASTLTHLAAELGVHVVGLTRRPTDVPHDLAPVVIDSTRQDLAEAILEATGGVGPDWAIDNVAAPAVFDSYFSILRNGARIVISGAIGDPDLPVLRVPAAPLYLRSIALIGVRTADLATIRDFWGLVGAGFRLPANVIHERPIEQAAAAHAAISQGTTAGHVVLIHN